MKKGMFSLCWLALASLVFACGAGAATVSYTGFIPGETTDWEYNLSLPQFDPAFGILRSVTFTIGGEVYGTASFESLEPASSTVSLDLSASLALSRPGATAELLVRPLATMVEAVGPYDGTVDWNGTSGRTLSFRAGRPETTQSQVLTDGLDQYIGNGDIVIPVSATALSIVRGPGNMRSSVTTIAEADVSVTYDYIVPEPGAVLSLAVGITGLWGLFITRRRRK